MYPLFLVVAVALVILSPLALEFWLTWYEDRKERCRAQQAIQAEHPELAWAFPRVR